MSTIQHSSSERSALSDHRRASLSIALFLGLFLGAHLGFARLHIDGEGSGWFFRQDAVVGLGGQVSLSGSSGHRDAWNQEMQQTLDLANGIQPSVPFLLAAAPLAGLLFSGRRKNGPTIGLVAGLLSLLAVLILRTEIDRLLVSIDWPLPLEASLEPWWGFWTSVAFAAATILWNVHRLQGRLQPATMALTEARS